MIKIPVINFKGGIAKSTTVIHLAAALSLLGKKVLAIDFDPQCSLSTGYKITKENQYTVYDFLHGKSGFRVTSKDNNLHVMAGSKSIKKYVLDIYVLKNRLEQLDNSMKKNKIKPYDFVIIDCPPEVMERTYYILPKSKKEIHIPSINEIALSASDYTLVPINAEEYSINGLNSFIEDVVKLKKDFNPSLEIGGVFFTMVMKNELDFKTYYKHIQESIPEKYFFNSFIRKDKNIGKSKKKGNSIFVKNPESNAALDYIELSKELLNRLKKD